MKELLKTGASLFLRGALHLFRIFPVRQNQVFFSAYSGHQYGCNPKYISEALNADYPGKMKLVWCWHDNHFPTEHPEITFVRFETFAYFKLLFTSKVVVLNDLQHCSYLPFRKSQTVIQTWHGCGLYKKVGRDVPDNTSWNDRRLSWTTNDITVFLSGAKQFSETVIRGAFGYNGKIQETGMPRNDILLDAETAGTAARKVRNTLNIPATCKLLLYAPTFRQKGEHAEDVLDVDRVLRACKQRFGEDFKLLLRSHYLLADAEKCPDERCLDVTKYPDMQELLCAADVMISDYSSCIWDFSLTGKPCFLYAPDLSNYRMDRDFYMDITKWPFPLAQSNEELVARIGEFDFAEYEKAVKEHLTELGCKENGCAAKTVAADIAKRCKVL